MGAFTCGLVPHASSLFPEHGYNGTTTAQIADAPD